MFRYIINHRSDKALPLEDLTAIKSVAPSLPKDAFRQWCADLSTDHCFYTLSAGVNPNLRIRIENPVSSIGGLIVDYDVPAPDNFEEKLKQNRRLVAMPTLAHRTSSGHFRLIWLFDEPVPVNSAYAKQFLVELCEHLHVSALFAGYDPCSENPAQYYELGYDHTTIGGALDPDIVTACLFKSASKRPVQSESSIPFDVVADEVLKRYGSRLESFQMGERVPLFWIEDGVERMGGQVTEFGIVCYSDRAGKGFVSWSEILGGKFVSEYETHKIGESVEGIYYDGKRYYKFARNGLFDFPKEDLVIQLRANGLSPDKKKGQRLSEVESALLYIQDSGRVHGIAPILHSKEKVVTVNGSVVLNSSRCKPVIPAESATAKDFPFLNGFFETLLDDPDGSNPKDYLFAWMKRSYEALHYSRMMQGQAVILVGPTGRGKSLFSNRILAGLLGGCATASDFLQARTAFNKELSESPVWVVDDTTSATNAADHRKFTELLKARIANPTVEVMAKYADSMRVPHIGRVVISLNEDVQSLSVVPALDVSNSDKILGFRISEEHRPEFLPNIEMEDLIDKELPYFARFLLDWTPPECVTGSARYGVAPYLHPFIVNAARDNGTRAPALEAIEMFARVHRDATGNTKWKGTATELRSLFCEYSDLSGLAFGRDHYQLARGLASAEEAHQTDTTKARPVHSESRGRGKRYTIDLSAEYDDIDD